jgi:hypothetical protein
MVLHSYNLVTFGTRDILLVTLYPIVYIGGYMLLAILYIKIFHYIK